MSVSDQELLHHLGRMPFVDTAELAMILGKAHVALHRGLTDLLSGSIVDRVSHGAAHLPSSRRYYLTAKGIREAAGIPGFETSSDHVRTYPVSREWLTFVPSGRGRPVPGVGGSQPVMGAGMIITMPAAYVEKRPTDGDADADLKRYLETNAVFYGAVAIFIVFYWNWFSNMDPDNVPDGQLWIVIDTMMPVVMGVAGCRLWRKVGAQGSFWPHPSLDTPERHAGPALSKCVFSWPP